MRILFMLCSALFVYTITTAQVSTPGTGVRWNLDSLVQAFPEVVLQSGDEYTLTEKITFTSTDTFYQDAGATVYFDSAATFEFIQATIQVAPDMPLIFTAADTAKGFDRIRLDSVAVADFNQVIFQFSSGISLIASNVSFVNCTVEQTKHIGNNASGAISALKSNLHIDSSSFTENARSAITVGATGNSGIRLLNSSFVRNDYENGNYPQINIGSANDSGVVIRNCHIEGGYTKSGGIGFLNITPTDYTIRVEGNTIINNRYGVAVIGRGVTGYIVNNMIDSNDIEGEPMLGGSGLNFQGDTSIQVVAAGNYIANNLWGVTVIAGNSAAPRISLGKISPVDVVDTGGNTFSGNGNNDTLFAIFNNSPDTVWAQNNFWDYGTIDSVEATVSHHPDDETLGWVIFDPLHEVPPPTGIDEVQERFATLYPNPVSLADPVVTIYANRPITAVSVVDISGKTIYTQQGIDAYDSQVNLSSFSAGIYFLRLEAGLRVQIQRVVLQ